MLCAASSMCGMCSMRGIRRKKHGIWDPSIVSCVVEEAQPYLLDIFNFPHATSFAFLLGLA